MEKSDSTQNKHTFYVHGMHCKACEMMIESAFKDVPYVTAVEANLSSHTVYVEGFFGDMTDTEVADALTKFVADHGYTLALQPQSSDKKWGEFKIAIPIALAFAVLFVLLQRAGIVNLVSTDSVSFGTVFIIGVIASLSTCMAVVGGLVLSMSATFVKGGDGIKPQFMFHVGRLISFFVLGGVIGMIGKAFTLNALAIFILGLIIGAVMLLMGANLLGVFHFTKRLQPSMPKFIARHAQDISKVNHSLTPLLVGIATFFLPCGFTQSMQIYTLTASSFWVGGLTMLSFALGTLPILALISFSSFSIRSSSKKSIFFKTAGLIVIMFALFNLLNSLVVIGLLPPIFNF